MLRNTWKNLANDLRRNKKVALQTSALFGAQIIVIILGFAIKGIQTRGLGAEEYGFYAFFGTVTSILMLLYQFGHYDSLMVLLAENEDKKREHEYFGLGLIFSIGMGILFAATVFLLSFGIDYYMGVKLGNIFRLFSPLTIIFPVYVMIRDLTVGSNRIYTSSLLDVTAKSLFIIPLFIIFQGGDLQLGEVIFLNLVTLLIATAAIFIWLKPSFKNLKSHYGLLKIKNKEYGWHLYTGSVTNQSTYKLDEVFISIFINTTQLGFYTLAGIICTPMVLLSKALSSSMFKRFAHSDRIPPKIFIYNTIWLIACVIGLFLLGDFIITFFFGAEFSVVAEYTMWLSFAYLFQGAYQPYIFLMAKSMGKQVRNVSLTEAVVNVVGNIVFIYFFGIYGVIAASILARLVHFIGLTYYYRKYFVHNSPS